LHLGLASAGFEASVFPQAGTLLGLITGGWCADRASRRWPGGRFSVVTAGFIGSALAMLWLGQADSLLGIRAAAMAFGFSNGWISGNQVPCAFDIVPEHLRASTVGSFNFLGGLVAGLGPLAGGFARGTIGLDQLMIYTAALLAVSAVFPLLAQRSLARRL
jgi:predicted MFS family arabinose efflux permease